MTQPLPQTKHNWVRNSFTGQDPRADEVINNPKGELGELYKAASNIYNRPMKKRYVEACLLCSDNLGEISEILEIPTPVLKVYTEFFFDIEGWDRLSKIEHIDALGNAGTEEKREEGTMKLWALNNGLDFIAWRLGKASKIGPVEGLQDLFNICIYKSKEAMYNSSTSDTSKESIKWVKLSTDISRFLKVWVMDSSAAKRDLEIAIKEVLPEFEGLDSLLELNEDLPEI